MIETFELKLNTLQDALTTCDRKLKSSHTSWKTEQDKASTMDLQLSRMQLLIDPLWQGIGKSVDTPYVAEESTLQVKLEGVVDHFKSESALHAAMQLDMIAKDSTIKEMEVEKTKMAKEIERLETKYHDVESRLQSAFKTMRSMKAEMEENTQKLTKFDSRYRKVKEELEQKKEENKSLVRH
jgi:DNA repair exonuclease SbcCD ATPase subunit